MGWLVPGWDLMGLEWPKPRWFAANLRDEQLPSFFLRDYFISHGKFMNQSGFHVIHVRVWTLRNRGGSISLRLQTTWWFYLQNQQSWDERSHSTGPSSIRCFHMPPLEWARCGWPVKSFKLSKVMRWQSRGKPIYPVKINGLVLVYFLLK